MKKLSSLFLVFFLTLTLVSNPVVSVPHSDGFFLAPVSPVSAGATASITLSSFLTSQREDKKGLIVEWFELRAKLKEASTSLVSSVALVHEAKYLHWLVALVPHWLQPLALWIASWFVEPEESMVLTDSFEQERQRLKEIHFLLLGPLANPFFLNPETSPKISDFLWGLVKLDSGKSRIFFELLAELVFELGELGTQREVLNFIQTKLARLTPARALPLFELAMTKSNSDEIRHAAQALYAENREKGSTLSNATGPVPRPLLYQERIGEARRFAQEMDILLKFFSQFESLQDPTQFPSLRDEETGTYKALADVPLLSRHHLVLGSFLTQVGVLQHPNQIFSTGENLFPEARPAALEAAKTRIYEWLQQNWFEPTIPEMPLHMEAPLYQPSSNINRGDKLFRFAQALKHQRSHAAITGLRRALNFMSSNITFPMCSTWVLAAIAYMESLDSIDEGASALMAEISDALSDGSDRPNKLTITYAKVLLLQGKRAEAIAVLRKLSQKILLISDDYLAQEEFVQYIQVAAAVGGEKAAELLNSSNFRKGGIYSGGNNVLGGVAPLSENIQVLHQLGIEEARQERLLSRLLLHFDHFFVPPLKMFDWGGSKPTLAENNEGTAKALCHQAKTLLILGRKMEAEDKLIKAASYMSTVHKNFQRPWRTDSSFFWETVALFDDSILASLHPTKHFFNYSEVRWDRSTAAPFIRALRAQTKALVTMGGEKCA